MYKYFAVLSRFLKLSWMMSTEYRINFVVWIAVEIGWTIMDLIMFTALLSNINAIGTWTFPQVLVLLGIYRVMVVPVWAWMFQSFRLIPSLISKGNLDLLLTKPIDSQFLVSVRQFSFTSFSSFIGGLIYIWVGLSRLHFQPNVAQILFSLLALFVSTILIYGVYFSTVALALYVGRLNNNYHVFVQAYDSARYPAEIFPVFLQRILTTIFPIAIILTVPAGILIAKVNYIQIIRLLVLGIIFVAVSRFIWQNGLRRYSSASS